MNNELTKLSDDELDELSYSSEYAEYIMNHAGGSLIICNGDTLLRAQEGGYLFDDFLESLGYCK